MTRICLVGAGYIAQVHAEALRTLPGVRIAAVVDPNPEAARRLAAAHGGTAHGSAEEVLRAGAVEAAHILAPPDAHRDAALPFLEAGLPVLVEKPLAVSGAECAELLAAARASGVLLGVNQNFVFHPAFVRLRRMVAEGRLGRPRFVDCVYNVPLHQLSVRQFGHWMFHEPGNILLEQAVHPLSQIVALAGPVRDLRALADPPVEIAPGLPFHSGTGITLACERLPAQLRYAVGQSFPFWRLSVVCDDGVAVADILANRVFTHGRTRWLEVVDNLASSGRSAAAILGEGVRNALDYGLSTLRLKGRSDPFFLSMRGSIAAFHAALSGEAAFETDGAFGAGLVEVCERVRDQAFVPAPRRAPALARAKAAPCEVAILGGTGFIGAETVRRFVAAGARVSVMARSVRNLPAIFGDERVMLHRGDIRDAAAVARAIGEAKVVVNLAHGGGGASFEEVRQAMVGGAETVARACLAQGVRRLVHVGSIASLYLGPQKEAVTGATPSDPRAEERADYSRAKALCDRLLLDLHAREGLPVVILRPGLVVGEGSAPLHAGLGFFNNDQHVIGWNGGRNPLPFVLVGDVAEAILLAGRAEGVEGRCYNLVGDVRPSAREYVAALAEAMGRPLRFHPQRPTWLWAEDLGKWLVKRIGGRAAPLPSRRELVSRGLLARFDCSDAKRDLGWRPVSDPAEFARQAIAVHAPRAAGAAPEARGVFRPAPVEAAAAP
ncbi:NAD-dependent epimerase/dehydratase family protein [Crenalkalicoccus roseus]|uniref:NAD-dependent epimerase/dehydratase family protein n=1 Tax=Crenalkalicoccus roseus TaxID=1485588 RepID=UPI0013050C63|nr:NAD-dependent epimerase/dehydratase family protein [Crenalkalicoccus roseus]